MSKRKRVVAGKTYRRNLGFGFIGSIVLIGAIMVIGFNNPSIIDNMPTLVVLPSVPATITPDVLDSELTLMAVIDSNATPTNTLEPTATITNTPLPIATLIPDVNSALNELLRSMEGVNNVKSLIMSESFDPPIIYIELDIDYLLDDEVLANLPVFISQYFNRPDIQLAVDLSGLNILRVNPVVWNYRIGEWSDGSVFTAYDEMARNNNPFIDVNENTSPQSTENSSSESMNLDVTEFEPSTFTIRNFANVRQCPQTTDVCPLVATLTGGLLIELNGFVSGQSIDDNPVWYRGIYNNQEVYVHSSLVQAGTLDTNSSTYDEFDNAPTTLPRPQNCEEAVAWEYTPEQAAQWSHLDRDNDGVACYGD